MREIHITADGVIIITIVILFWAWIIVMSYCEWGWSK